MIRKSFTSMLLAAAMAVAGLMASGSLCRVSAQEDSGISLGGVKFGKKEDNKWLKVDIRDTRSASYRGSSGRQPVVGFNSPTSAFSSTTAVRPGTRVSNGRLVLASRIAVSNARRHSTKSCWRYVKNALLEADVVDTRPVTAYAKQAGYELEQNYGFVKTNIRNPLAAPVGSVLVYGGRGAGHVEIRANEGFVSDFISPKPSPRPLIGVYVKR